MTPSESAWQTAFPATTAVRDYPKPKVTDVPWNSYPAHRTPDHALEAHYASTCSCPVSRPSVLGNPLADEVLDVLQRHRGRRRSRRTAAELHRAAGPSPLRDDQRPGPGRPRRRRTDQTGARDRPARRRRPSGPGPAGPGGPDVNVAAAGPSWQSPIESLLDRTNTDRLVTEFLNRLLNEPALVTNPMLAMLRDVHAAQRYYNRPEEQKTHKPRPTPGVHPPRTPHPIPDFHERAASAGNVPALARTLGFVVDVRVDDLDALRAASTIRCDVIIDGAEEYMSPETQCTTVGSRFLAVAGDQPVAGRSARPGRSRALPGDGPGSGRGGSGTRAAAAQRHPRAGDRGERGPQFLCAGGVARHRFLDRRARPSRRTARADRQRRDAGAGRRGAGNRAAARTVRLRGAAAGNPGRGVGRRHPDVAQPARAPGSRVVRRQPDSRRRPRHRLSAESAAEPHPRQSRRAPVLRARGAGGLGRLEPVGAAAGPDGHSRRRQPRRRGQRASDRQAGGAGRRAAGAVHGRAEVAARAALRPPLLIPGCRCRPGRQQRADGSAAHRGPAGRRPLPTRRHISTRCAPRPRNAIRQGCWRR